MTTIKDFSHETPTNRSDFSCEVIQFKRRHRKPRLKKLDPPIPFDNTNTARFMLDVTAFEKALGSR